MRTQNSDKPRNVTPRFDGTREGPIKDAMATQASKMGIRADIDPLNPHQATNPFHVTPTMDPEMKKFESIMEGNNPSK
ncbi:hypothetical protein ACFOU2_00885 [Bacillus songklensis]|uniref:Small, acid-soluble spore protein K n=1 Tax=Bacillus songklensis TaxID=1069116 RepID=A0ABV8AW29_9BACI